MRTEQEIKDRMAHLANTTVSNDPKGYRHGLLEMALRNSSTVQDFLKVVFDKIPELEHSSLRRNIDIYNGWMAHYTEWAWLCGLDDLAARCALETFAPFGNPRLILEIKAAFEDLKATISKTEEVVDRTTPDTFPEVSIDDPTKVNNLEAGPKMDALVAKYVFGWQQVYLTGGHSAGVPVGQSITADNFVSVPRFSTESNAAAAVLSKYEDSEAITICLNNKGFRIYGLWAVQIIQKGKFGHANGETIPEALCKAAILLNLK